MPNHPSEVSPPKPESSEAATSLKNLPEQEPGDNIGNSPPAQPSPTLDSSSSLSTLLGQILTTKRNPLYNLSTIAERKCFSFNVPVISPMSKLRAYWNSMIILLVAYTSVVLPLRTAFLWHDQDINVEEGSIAVTGWTIVDIVIDFIFLLDVILNFNTGYIQEPDFVIVLGRKKIALQYIKTWFLFDILSSLPLDLIILHPQDKGSTNIDLSYLLRINNALRLVKVLRLPRAVRYAQRLHIFAGMSTFRMRIAKLVITAGLFLHWNACIQFFVAAATDFPPGNWVEQIGLAEDKIATKYSWAVFLATSQMFSIGYGPQVPVLVQEAWVIWFSMTMGHSMFVVLVGIITSMLISLDSISSTFKYKVEIVNHYMAHRKLPLDLREKIRNSMNYKWRTQRCLDEQTILNDIPVGLRLEACMHICKPLIAKVPLFNDVSVGCMELIVMHLRPDVYLAGEAIIKQGTYAYEMFFLNKGTVKITVDDVDVAGLEDGGFFGERSILNNTVHSATCWAMSDCEVFMILRNALEEVIKVFPELKDRFMQAIENHFSNNTNIARSPSISLEEANNSHMQPAN